MPISYQISLTGDCSNTNSGELSLSLIGTAPYSITWDVPISITQTGQTSPYTYGGLSAGTYSLIVTDSSTGPQIQNVSFVVFSSSTASILGITNPSCGNNNGTISVGTTATATELVNLRAMPLGLTGLTPGANATTSAAWDDTGTSDKRIFVKSANAGDGVGTLTVRYIQAHDLVSSP